MPMTSDAEQALKEAVRGLRTRLLTDLHGATVSAWQMGARVQNADLDAATRATFEAWAAEQVRTQAAAPAPAKRSRGGRRTAAPGDERWLATSPSIQHGIRLLFWLPVEIAIREPCALTWAGQAGDFWASARPLIGRSGTQSMASCSLRPHTAHGHAPSAASASRWRFHSSLWKSALTLLPHGGKWCRGCCSGDRERQ
jgi:hypothetical protein